MSYRPKKSQLLFGVTFWLLNSRLFYIIMKTIIHRPANDSALAAIPALGELDIKGDCMSLLGIISGTLVMDKSDLFQKSTLRLMKNEYGQAVALVNDRITLVFRHGNDPDNHILPHLINHQANLQALKDLGVAEVVGINSTGSLKKDLYPGLIIIPDDFITQVATPTIHRNKAVHITPSLNEEVRQKLIGATLRGNIEAVGKGTYWQTPGPRLETKAEIKMMANFADVVGMTMASEAVIALELGLPYASACSIDNFGNGLIEKPLNMEEILIGTRKNGDLMIRLLEGYLQTVS
jgi:5'-methylthioadenosine phosphorylase